MSPAASTPDMWERKQNEKSEEAAQTRETREKSTCISGEYFSKFFTQTVETNVNSGDWEQLAKDEQDRKDRETYMIYESAKYREEQKKKKQVERYSMMSESEEND